jgi:nucleoside-diphosphate-sugar epimerase
MAKVIVAGASGLVGNYAVAHLAASGHSVVGVSRKPATHPLPPGVEWHRADLTKPGDVAGLPDCTAIVSTLHILTTASFVKQLTIRPLSRIVAFSSTSAITKADANEQEDREVSANLSSGEAALREYAPDLTVTVLRPTMIYAHRGDRNVERVADQLRRFPIFPLIGSGIGLRQPVHAEDLAIALCQILDCPNTGNQTYNLGGGEVLTFREMVSRIGLANGVAAKFLPIPLPLAHAALRLASLSRRYRGIPTGALERMEKDLVFDNAPASTDFGYQPRSFQPPIYPRQDKNKDP